MTLHGFSPFWASQTSRFQKSFGKPIASHNMRWRHVNPSEAEPVTEDEYQEAVMMAEQVVQWAENILSMRQA